VKSPRFIDQDDKIYPAVRSILDALNQRDPDYPPLQIVHAKLQGLLKNPEGMKRHLDKAVSLAPDFYAAHHLLGEFYFNTNDPVKAYKSLLKAEQSHKYPPEFTEEDFYYETESLGKTYAVMGNIFYYFFDRVKGRYGTIDNQIVEETADRTWNYNIARDNYEKALEEKFESPELRYNLGRVYYLNSDWKSALEQWLYLYEDFIEAPELMISLGNAFYHSGNLAAARGEYLKLITSFEHETDRIKSPKQSNTEHYKYYMGLSTAYNNLAAAYQEEDNESKSVLAYWKSIDYAQRFGHENEYSRVNLARAFKGDRKIKPIIDEEIPYSIKYYNEDMRRPL
jgi:tetratricopeptide (TPR) repeat protein